MTDREAYDVNRRLDRHFFTGGDVVDISKNLLGHLLVTRFDHVITAGIIVETEAYRAPEDRASHAWNNRKTARTEVMFHQGGTAYVYLCYGIHHLFNVVTGDEGVPHAILIRAIEPIYGLEIMMKRRHHEKPTKRLSAGPGTLSQALGIHTGHSGLDICDPDAPIWISPSLTLPDPSRIRSGSRIGIDYAGEWASKPWRFILDAN